MCKYRGGDFSNKLFPNVSQFIQNFSDAQYFPLFLENFTKSLQKFSFFFLNIFDLPTYQYSFSRISQKFFYFYLKFLRNFFKIFRSFFTISLKFLIFCEFKRKCYKRTNSHNEGEIWRATENWNYLVKEDRGNFLRTFLAYPSSGRRGSNT